MGHCRCFEFLHLEQDDDSGSPVFSNNSNWVELVFSISFVLLVDFFKETQLSKAIELVVIGLMDEEGVVDDVSIGSLKGERVGLLA